MLSRPLKSDELRKGDVRNLHVCTGEQTGVIKIDGPLNFFAVFEVEFWVLGECFLLFFAILD